MNQNITPIVQSYFPNARQSYTSQNQKQGIVQPKQKEASELSFHYMLLKADDPSGESARQLAKQLTTYSDDVNVSIINNELRIDLSA